VGASEHVRGVGVDARGLVVALDAALVLFEHLF
jgi:hypothetical protein